MTSSRSLLLYFLSSYQWIYLLFLSFRSFTFLCSFFFFLSFFLFLSLPVCLFLSFPPLTTFSHSFSIPILSIIHCQLFLFYFLFINTFSFFLFPSWPIFYFFSASFFLFYFCLRFSFIPTNSHLSVLFSFCYEWCFLLMLVNWMPILSCCSHTPIQDGLHQIPLLTPVFALGANAIQVNAERLLWSKKQACQKNHTTSIIQRDY